jgi:ABC-2 type transport system ATP-binding protein
VLPDGGEIKDIYAIAADTNVQVRRLSYKRDSLEDIFLKAMEERTNGSV